MEEGNPMLLLERGEKVPLGAGAMDSGPAE